jgi:acyl-CoA synthetase (AMP-forming)/AMP-acid ligase II
LRTLKLKLLSFDKIPNVFPPREIGALVEPLSGRRWEAETTAEEVDLRVSAYASLGVRPRDFVFLHHGNCPEFFADLCALWRLGACAVPIDPRLTPFEIGRLVRAAPPRLSIWNEAPRAEFSDPLEAAGASTVLTSHSRRSRTSTGTRTPDETFSSLDLPALVLFTSGTTGDPKGVIHTHRTLRARWSALGDSLGTFSFRRTLCLLPTHFGHGLICNALFPWFSGADLYLAPPFRSEIVTDLGRIIDDHGLTFMSSVPSLWRLALKTARPPTGGTLDRVFCGSAPLSAALWNDVREWSGTREVWNAYGLTEAGSWVAGTSVPGFVPRDGLIGVPWGADIRILRSATTESGPPLTEACAPDEPGYVWIKTPALMQGYLNRDDLTRSVMTDGWFMTGDIGVLDEHGHLSLRGRERDEINKGGMKVYPADIDAAFDAFDSVKDVCAFGYEGDPLYGENVAIALVLSDPSHDGLRRLYRGVRRVLAAHQMPVRWYLVDEIPRTSRGKSSRQGMAAACATLTPLRWQTILEDNKK